MTPTMQQAPIRNAQRTAVSVYTHSGEFVPSCNDLRLKGRGFDLEFTRHYRSALAANVGELGRGWSCGLGKRLEREDNNVLYHNGTGEIFRFLQGKTGAFTSPIGYYGILLQEKDSLVIRRRYGQTLRFEPLEYGGKILSVEDRNQNFIRFAYSESSVLILDTLGRKAEVSINNGLIRRLTDCAGRSWNYVYDSDDCLVEVIQPATTDFPQGTSIKYTYDRNHRLVSLIDAKGQTYLTVDYDSSGRVVTQKNGNGICSLEYKAIGKNVDGFPIFRTTCHTKSGAMQVFEHNEAGHVISNSVSVRRMSFPAEDIAGLTGNMIKVVTTSTYNQNSELTSRQYPSGQEWKWEYAEHDSDSLAHGNLLRITRRPQAGVESDQAGIVTIFEYESMFQMCVSRSDPRGNKTSFAYDGHGNLQTTVYPLVSIQPVDGGLPRVAPLSTIHQRTYAYNSRGQLLRLTSIDGSVTEYHYYPITDPCGARGPSSATAAPDQLCGYLARVVQDVGGANVKCEYAYDRFGNVATLYDGKNNPTRLRYNSMGKLEGIMSRDPFKYTIEYKYDANYNEIELKRSFERLTFDSETNAIKQTSSTQRELKEYNALDNLTARHIYGDDNVVSESFIRDENERIIRQIQPLGNITEYKFDERDLLIEKVCAVGTKEAFLERFSYNLDGALRNRTDGTGHVTQHHYDGFQRYRGFTSPSGTTKKQWLDETGNVVRVTINGVNSSLDSGGRIHASLMETNYQFDQWNRLIKTERSWCDSTTGQSLGKSNWDAEQGIVCTLVEYAENGLPGKVWIESGNVISYEYDGAGRLSAIKDKTGEGRSIEYDENSNATLIRHFGPEVDGRPVEWVQSRNFDGMDRIVLQQDNDDRPVRYRYNSLGAVIGYVGKSGVEIAHMHDALGRHAGHAYTVADSVDQNRDQLQVRSYQYDNNYRLTAYVDATGKRTIYCYDALGRQVVIVYSDGSTAHVDYDANGNAVRVIDPNGDEIVNRYDADGLLVERKSHSVQTGSSSTEKYQYDGVNRMVSVVTPDGVVRRTYDSLSRLLKESQGNHEVRYAYDSASNLTNIKYPGGDESQRSYDLRNRVVSVRNKAGKRIANFSYRENDQLSQMLLGEGVRGTLSYNTQQRLESIEYRRTYDNALLESFSYRYDSTGKMTHELQTSMGPSFGERYYHDNANRVIRAQYGVQDVFNPNSAFQNETSYEYFEEGLWKRRIDKDDKGRVTDDNVGEVNDIERYRNFGEYSFSYDANGNRVRKERAKHGDCFYTYDKYNRLIKVECRDEKGQLIQTIEYFYDGLGRQVRKLVTDNKGIKTEYTYVWAGALLIEEYENGQLVRSYCHGIGSMPSQLSITKNSPADFTYIFNGRGLTCGLVDRRDPTAFAEKYGYEVTGASFITEIGGVPVTLSARDATVSSLANSILSGGELGSILRDWSSGTQSSIGGRHFDGTISTALNSLGDLIGRGYQDSASAFSEQLNGYLNMLGIGGGTRGVEPTSSSVGINSSGSATMHNPAWSLYADGEDDPLTPPPLVGVNDDGTTTVYGDGHDSTEWTPYPGKSSDAPVNVTLTPKDSGPVGALTGLGGAGTNEKAPYNPYDNPGNAAINKWISENPWEAAAIGLIIKGIVLSTGGGKPSQMSVPDENNAVTFPTPKQIESWYYRNRTPVNPNWGSNRPQIDQASPPLKTGGLDPTISYFVEDGSGGSGAGSFSPPPSTNFTDFHPGFGGLMPQLNPTTLRGVTPGAEGPRT